ncbi:cytochrome P450 [Oscillatoria sp. FACHB-1406]|uniref:cytochrome P450 n=1 Tax=Oscillatoria sp. FACHB-1406 TaxID=2692846 RepID=UPI0016852AD3|nr:cytochrome P450 [Oscillatoria sp. FACHB-1406]MBD2580470.1 cytochrome P450 [Oscillatoria sp. FACHB-1406]
MTQLHDGPRAPQLLQLIQWIADPFAYLDANAKRYGETFTVRFSNWQPMVFFSHPQANQEIFMGGYDAFTAGSSNGILRPLVGDNSLLLLDGDRHKRERKLLMPPFHGERLQSYGRMIQEIAENAAQQLVPGKTFIARDLMQEITLQVIMQAVFGLREGERYAQLKPLLASILEITNSPLRSSFIFFDFLQKDWGSWSPWGRMLLQQRKIEALLQEEINERRDRSQSDREDILSLMMQARDEDGNPMSDRELLDELMTLLFAGHETTATALAWAMYWVHFLPEVGAKLLAELETAGNNIEAIEIAKLPYLNAFCNETLRIYPVAIISAPRVALKPVQVMGQRYSAYTPLVPCIYLTHRREDLYPEPEQFKPERFLERQYTVYEFVPFGGGNRRCIGYALALLEMKLVLATLLSHCEFELADNKPVKPERRGVTMTPAGGVRVKLKRTRDRNRQLDAMSLVT